MKEIVNKPWDYIFYEKEGNYFLKIIVGSVAIFEVNIKLNASELSLFKKNGLDYIENLAKNIQNSPSKYANRTIK